MYVDVGVSVDRVLVSVCLRVYVRMYMCMYIGGVDAGFLWVTHTTCDKAQGRKHEQHKRTRF